MAVPAVVGVGAVASGTTTITPALPAGAAAGHLLVTLAECTGNQVYTVPTGWAHVLNSPVNLDTTTRLTVIYRFMQAGDTAPAIALPGGDHAVGRMIAISGVRTTGNPWDATPQPTTESVADTSATWNAVTTTVNECLILFCIATGRDFNSTTNMGALTGGTGLTSITEQIDNGISTGAGGFVGLVTAEKLTAGSTGTPGATMGSTDGKALLTLALAPAPAASGPPILVTLPPMRSS
jgi:hypothetical protein